jgi:O-antigen/teichoic acid export membrane protein
MTGYGGEKSQNLRLALRNSVFGFLSLSCRLVGASLIFVMIARLPCISVSGFGELTYAAVLAALSVMVSQFGFAPLLIRDVASDPSRLPAYARSVASLRLLFAVAALAALIGYVHLIDMTGQARWICGIIAVAFQVGSFSADLQAIFQSREKMHLEFVGIAVENVLLVALARLAFLWQPSLTEVACIFLTAKSAALIVNYLLCGWFVLWVYPVVNWGLWKSMLWEATPFALAGIVALGIVQIDTVLLRELSPGDAERTVGLYQAAVRLFLVPMLLPQIVLKVFLPQLSRMHGQSGQGLVRDLGRVNHILLTLGLLIGLVTLFRGADLVRLCYGDKLADAGPLLQVLGATIMMRFGAAYTIYFTIRNRIWFRVVSALVALAAVVAFDWMLIPRYGALGAAYASVLAHVVYWIPFLAATYLSERTVSLGWQALPALVAAGVLVAALCATAGCSLLYMLPVYAMAVLLLTFVTMPQGERNRFMTHILLRGA